jgi:CBS domain-containing protein
MATDRDETERLAAEEQPMPDELQSVLALDTLGDVIQQTPLTVSVGTTLAKAISRMQAEHSGYVAALKEGKLAGIFTERDLLLRVAGRQLHFDQATVNA